MTSFKKLFISLTLVSFFFVCEALAKRNIPYDENQEYTLPGSEVKQFIEFLEKIDAVSWTSYASSFEMALIKSPLL